MIRKLYRNFFRSSPIQTDKLSTVTLDERELFSLDWWSANKKLFPDELQGLTEQFVNGSDFNLCSQYWLHLMKKNYEMLLVSGIEHFATTISRNYFTWTDFSQAQIINLRLHQIDNKIPLDIFKKHNGFSEEESYKHNILIALLYKSIINLPFSDRALKLISDKGFLFGSAPFLEHNGLILTLDKLSAITEIAIFEKEVSESSILCEIGGGSGRDTDAILQLFPRVKMIYCDIPPASYIALSRFKIVFPDKYVLVVKSAEELHSLLASTEKWDILIISPEMLEYIPDKYVDLLLAIDCLHEFSNANRAKMAGVIQRVSTLFYTKNWTDTIIPYDNIPLSSNHLSGYYFPDSWEVLHGGTCIFPGNFTEFLFRIHDNVAP